MSVFAMMASKSKVCALPKMKVACLLKQEFLSELLSDLPKPQLDDVKIDSAFCKLCITYVTVNGKTYLNTYLLNRQYR